MILRTHENLWTTPFKAVPLQSWLDLDGDDLSEILLSDEHVREVRFVSSVTGGLLRVLTSNDAVLGIRLESIDDVTGDGVRDLLVSGNQAHLFSGSTLAEVWSGILFDSATAIGDVDGDRSTDFVLAGYGLDRHDGSVRVLRGGRYTVLYTIPNPTLDTVQYGDAVVALGDVDGDGIGDFAVGAPSPLSSDTVCEPGEIFVHSGADGDLLYRLEGEGVGSGYGGSLACPGDVTGDGIGDLAAGAPLCCRAPYCEFFPGPGRISFYDGVSGELLEHYEPDLLGTQSGTGLGGRLIAIGDLDGNGWGDVLTNVGVFLAERLPNGDLRVINTLLALDGRTRTPIYRMWNPHWELCSGFVSALASAGDLDRDDFPDWFQSTSCGRIGQPDDRVFVISGAPVGVRSLGQPCGGAPGAPAPRIGATGVPEIGSHYAIHLTGIEDGTPVRLFLGELVPGKPRPVTGGCAPWVRAAETRATVAKEVRPGVAVATELVTIPNDPALIGAEFHAQWSIGSGPGARATRVLAIEIQPQNPLRGW